MAEQKVTVNEPLHLTECIQKEFLLFQDYSYNSQYEG